MNAPAPLQRAGVAAMQLPASYYEELTKQYHHKRDGILQTLDQVGIPYFAPKRTTTLLKQNRAQ